MVVEKWIYLNKLLLIFYLMSANICSHTLEWVHMQLPLCLCQDCKPGLKTSPSFIIQAPALRKAKRSLEERTDGGFFSFLRQVPHTVVVVRERNIVNIFSRHKRWHAAFKSTAPLTFCNVKVAPNAWLQKANPTALHHSLLLFQKLYLEQHMAVSTKQLQLNCEVSGWLGKQNNKNYKQSLKK